MAFSMPLPFCKCPLNIERLFRESKIEKADAFKAIGIGAATALILFNYNFKVSFMTNVIDRFNKILTVFYPILTLTDTSITGIKFYRFLWENLPKDVVKMAEIDDINIEDSEVKLRIYRPMPRSHYKQPPPVIVYFHGGGFVLGSIAAVEHITTLLAKKTGYVVVSVEYRLAPEFKFPAAPEDCLLATNTVLDRAAEFGIDPKRIIVAGDSAGGTLSSIVAHQLRQNIAFQVLIYPGIPTIGRHTESLMENRHAPILSADLVSWFKARYFRDYTDLYHPLSCPLNSLTLKDMPPSFVITAEFDVLRDEGREYVRLLKEAKVPTIHKEYSGAVHGFYGMKFLSHGKKAIDDTAEILLGEFGSV